MSSALFCAHGCANINYVNKIKRHTMDARIHFRVDEETKKLAQMTAERKGITISDACRELTEELASEQREMEKHDEWLQKEVAKAYEKINAGKATFVSHSEAKRIRAERKKEIKAKYQTTA